MIFVILIVLTGPNCLLKTLHQITNRTWLIPQHTKTTWAIITHHHVIKSNYATYYIFVKNN